MTTFSDVVTGALRRLRVVNPRKTVDGVAASEALTALNDMMHAWKGVGVDIDHDTAELSEDFTLGPEHVQGAKALLAVRLAGDYGLEVNQGIVRDAEMGWEAIQAEYVEGADNAEFDSGLTYMTLGRCM